MIWMVIFVVLMILWPVLDCYMSYDAARPHLLARTLIPWLCVLILGMVVFGAISNSPPRF